MSEFAEINRKEIDWLLKGDPSIRYQTFRDLLVLDKKTIEFERDQIPKTGWGYKLLSLQKPDGTWANSIYSPKWISTFYTLLLLKRLGMKKNADIQKACMLILNKCYNADKGINVSHTLPHSDACVTGMFLSIVCHFKIKDERIEGLVEYIKNIRMKDSGWNCEWHKGATHSSFHTTLSIIEGLNEYEKTENHSKSITGLQNEAMEFLLKHRLFRSHRTGEVANPQFTRFSFPPRWYYDIMKALDYAQERKLRRDTRFKDAVKILKIKRTKEGFWKLQNNHPGKVYFDMEKVGKPSRWNTLRALRILKWWNDT